MADQGRATGNDARASGLVLATDGPAVALERVAPATARIRTVSDPSRYAELLGRDRPRLATVPEPPVDDAALEASVRERRRRSSLRR